MNILGISCFYHDSAACLLVDGEISGAAQEERFTRIKHDANFPTRAIEYCLSERKIFPKDLDYVVFYDKPLLKFERLIETYLAFAPFGFNGFKTSLPLWVKDKIFQKKKIIDSLKELKDGENIDWEKIIRFSEHHLSHAASAFFPSPFKSAAILTLDGVGEWTTTSLSVGNNNSIKMLNEISFPHSIGLLYSAFTYYLGFKVNSGEYKVMGLAPYGEPIYSNLIKENLIDIKNDGSFALDISFFDYCTDIKMTNEKFDRLFGAPPRKPESELTQRDMNRAASIQNVTEEIYLKLAKNIAKTSGEKNLCLAGGVALNCVANGKLKEKNYFQNIWIQPASGDAGGSLGAALIGYHMMLGNARNLEIKDYDRMHGSFLGPHYTNDEITKDLKKCGAVFEIYSEENLIREIAEALANQSVIGLMNGRMEFGPRSLGSRSIIADPRSSAMQKKINLKVKYRESFRPFAPSVLKEDVNEWFDFDDQSPYMLLVANVKNDKKILMTDEEQKLFGIDKLNIPRSKVPAVTHVDYTSRIQTVDRKTNQFFYDLLTEFKKITGCPVVVNTSFNVRGEPIVCSPEDAFKCFMATDLDLLVVGNAILRKEEQDKKLKIDYKDKFELD